MQYIIHTDFHVNTSKFWRKYTIEWIGRNEDSFLFRRCGVVNCGDSKILDIKTKTFSEIRRIDLQKVLHYARYQFKRSYRHCYRPPIFGGCPKRDQIELGSNRFNLQCRLRNFKKGTYLPNQNIRYWVDYSGFVVFNEKKFKKN